MARSYKQGIYKPTNPHKYRGDVTNIIYRSSWEWKFLRWCDLNPSVIEYSSEELVIPYICPTDNRMHRYFTDAVIKVKDASGKIKTYVVEIKPDAQTRPPEVPKRKTKRYIQEVMTWGKNSAKWKYAKEYCKDRGYEFIILTEHHLGIK